MLGLCGHEPTLSYGCLVCLLCWYELGLCGHDLCLCGHVLCLCGQELGLRWFGMCFCGHELGPWGNELSPCGQDLLRQGLPLRGLADGLCGPLWVINGFVHLHCYTINKISLYKIICDKTNCIWNWHRWKWHGIRQSSRHCFLEVDLRILFNYIKM